MKVKTKKNFVIVIIIIATMIGTVAYAINWAFFDIQRIDGHISNLINFPRRKIYCNCLFK